MKNKRKCAVFTIVKNESFFLPIWLKHYRKYFCDYDIYVLDHQSTDGSTENLPVNVEIVKNELSYDHQWLLNTISKKQRELLDDYECVLFSESDEIVYTINCQLDEYIDTFIDSHLQYVTCQSYEVSQNFEENERNLNDDEEIFANRNWWTRQAYTANLYDKTLLSKIPLEWEPGFHNISYPRFYTNNFFMVHLKRYDFEQLLSRNRRGREWNAAPTHLAAKNNNEDRKTVYIIFIEKV
jgi:hypothetical protein